MKFKTLSLALVWWWYALWKYIFSFQKLPKIISVIWNLGECEIAMYVLNIACKKVTAGSCKCRRQYISPTGCSFSLLSMFPPFHGSFVPDLFACDPFNHNQQRDQSHSPTRWMYSKHVFCSFFCWLQLNCNHISAFLGLPIVLINWSVFFTIRIWALHAKNYVSFLIHTTPHATSTLSLLEKLIFLLGLAWVSFRNYIKRVSVQLRFSDH